GAQQPQKGAGQCRRGEERAERKRNGSDKKEKGGLPPSFASQGRDHAPTSPAQSRRAPVADETNRAQTCGDTTLVHGYQSTKINPHVALRALPDQKHRQLSFPTAGSAKICFQSKRLCAFAS